MEWRGGSRAKANIGTSQRQISHDELTHSPLPLATPLCCTVLFNLCRHSYKLIGTMCMSVHSFNKKEKKKNAVFTLKINNCQPTHPNIKDPHTP